MASPTALDLEATTLAILAGGEGKRMGQPKYQLQIANQPILAYMLDRLRWPGPTLLVTAPGRQNPPAHNLFSQEVIDPVPNQGPLRGILTALECCSTPYLVVTTVDMPAIGQRELIWLLDSLTTHADAHALMLTRTIAGKPPKDVTIAEPFPFAARPTAAPIISRRLQDQQRSVRSLATLDGFLTTPAPTDWPDSVWTNVNTPNDWTTFQANLRPR